MKKFNLFFLLAFVCSALFLTSCDSTSSGDEGNNPIAENEVVITGNITENTTWDKSKVYILGGRVSVVSGVTLTIEAGTVVKGQAGVGANASALVIARGAKIMAEGTESEPIIFTSQADRIESGSIVSPNLTSDQNGLWGGLIVLGNAPISADASSVQIEGIPASDANGLYGGDKSDDNSGVIKYVSIRHGGSNIGEGNEINGLTLGGVGSGTKIEYIEIVSNQDDGIECFGGSVNVSNILVWNQGDDAFDMDQAYAGTISNFVYIGGPNSDHGMELDGPEGSANTSNSFTLTKGTLKGYYSASDSLGGELADLRDSVICTISDCYFFNFGKGSDIELDGSAESANYTAGLITFTGLSIKPTFGDALTKILADKSSNSAFDGIVDSKAKIVTTKTGGADASVFSGWTWASADNQLTDF